MRKLLWCGPAGAALFIVVFLIEGALRDGYDPVRHPISSLELTERGWIQVASFIATGVLFLAFALGVHKAGGGKALPVFLGLVAVGLIGAGVFKSYPVGGYPAGAPEDMTAIGALHDIFSMGVFLGLPVACFVAAYRGLLRWISIVAALAFLLTFVLASVGFDGDATFAPIGGLMQRVSILIGWTWIVALALRLLRDTGRGPVPGP